MDGWGRLFAPVVAVVAGSGVRLPGVLFYKRTSESRTHSRHSQSGLRTYYCVQSLRLLYALTIFVLND